MHRHQKTLDLLRKQTGVQAVVAVLRIDGDVAWEGVSQDVAGGDGMISAHSRFSIYSVTKSLVAVCALRLAQSGVLNPEDPVSRWIDGLPFDPSITLSQILGHNAGIPDYGGLQSYHESVAGMPSTPWSDEKFLDETLREREPSEPDTAWAYSNLGYLILRRVIEAATGDSLGRCVKDQVISVLGLQDTFVAETVSDWETCMPGYGGEVTTDGTVVDVRSVYHPDWCGPGVAVSTCHDVTEFYDALFRGELLRSEYLERMLTLTPVPGTFPPVVRPGYGLGIAADPEGLAGPMYGHGGSGPGYTLEAWTLPDSPMGRVAVTLACNGSGVPGILPCILELLQGRP